MSDVTLKKVILPSEYFDVPTIMYDVYVASIERIVGRVEFRFEEDQDLIYYGNIGYVIYLPYRGHSYAYQATVKLIEIISEQFDELNEVYITCNPDNEASKRTIEKLGVTFVATVDIEKEHELYRLGDKQKNVYIKYIE